MTKLITVFSEYEIKNSAIKINNGTDTGFKKSWMRGENRRNS